LWKAWALKAGIFELMIDMFLTPVRREYFPRPRLRSSCASPPEK